MFYRVSEMKCLLTYAVQVKERCIPSNPNPSSKAGRASKELFRALSSDSRFHPPFSFSASDEYNGSSRWQQQQHQQQQRWWYNTPPIHLCSNNTRCIRRSNALHETNIHNITSNGTCLQKCYGTEGATKIWTKDQDGMGQVEKSLGEGWFVRRRGGSCFYEMLLCVD